MLCAVLEGSKEDGGNLSQKLPATDHVYDRISRRVHVFPHRRWPFTIVTG